MIRWLPSDSNVSDGVKKGKVAKKMKTRQNYLTGVLESSSDTLHGQDESIFEPRSVITCGIQLYQFISRFRFHVLLRNMRPQSHMVVRVPDSLQCISLSHVQCRDVGITETKPLLQVQVSFQKILVPSNLIKQIKKRKMLQYFLS